MQREGNCPLNARAFAKLNLLTIFFSVYLEMPFFQWTCGGFSGMQREGHCPLKARARALGAVKEAIAYSMAALLLAGKLGTFI